MPALNLPNTATSICSGALSCRWHAAICGRRFANLKPAGQVRNTVQDAIHANHLSDMSVAVFVFDHVSGVLPGKVDPVLLRAGFEVLLRILIQRQMPARAQNLGQRVNDVLIKPQTAINRDRLSMSGSGPVEGDFAVIPDGVGCARILVFGLANAAGIYHERPAEARFHRQMRVADEEEVGGFHRVQFRFPQRDFGLLSGR